MLQEFVIYLQSLEEPINIVKKIVIVNGTKKPWRNEEEYILVIQIIGELCLWQFIHSLKATILQGKRFIHSARMKEAGFPAQRLILEKVRKVLLLKKALQSMEAV